MPDIVIIAGPNGAGKSTLAPILLRDTFGITDYVNADTIAEGLSAFAPEMAALDAGRIMLRRIRVLAGRRDTFAFETTLAGRHYVPWLKSLKDFGYRVHIVFLWLKQPDLAIERVRERVRSGGHNVPDDAVRRRYERGVRNFFRYYKELADSWQFYDTSDSSPILIAEGDRYDGEMPKDNELWKKLSSSN